LLKRNSRLDTKYFLLIIPACGLCASCLL